MLSEDHLTSSFILDLQRINQNQEGLSLAYSELAFGSVHTNIDQAVEHLGFYWVNSWQQMLPNLSRTCCLTTLSIHCSPLLPKNWSSCLSIGWNLNTVMVKKVLWTYREGEQFAFLITDLMTCQFDACESLTESQWWRKGVKQVRK